MNKLAQVDIGETFFGGPHFLTSLPGLGTLVSIFLSNALVIAGIVFIFLIIFGGYQMMASAGKPQEVARGREIILAAIIGFIIVFISYWIVVIIERATGMSVL